MPTVKVKVFGAGSMEIEGKDPKEIYSAITFHLGLEKAWEVHDIKRGRRAQVKNEEKDSPAA